MNEYPSVQNKVSAFCFLTIPFPPLFFSVWSKQFNKIGLSKTTEHKHCKVRNYFV